MSEYRLPKTCIFLHKTRDSLLALRYTRQLKMVPQHYAGGPL